MRMVWQAARAALLVSVAAMTPAFADDSTPPSGNASATSGSTTSGSSTGDSIVDQGMAMFDDGKLLATGGVSDLEGAGGGGLATWAVTTGYGTRDGIGLDGHFTYIALPNYSLWTEGAAVGLWDRVELSYAHLTFNTQNVGAALGLGKNFEFDQDGRRRQSETHRRCHLRPGFLVAPNRGRRAI